MASTFEHLPRATDYFPDRLINWYEVEYGNHIQEYFDLNLKIIASFYGDQKLQQECNTKIADLWGVLKTIDEHGQDDLGGLDLSDTQCGYGAPAGLTCLDIWDLLDLDKLIKLTKEGEKAIKKLNTIRSTTAWKWLDSPATFLAKNPSGYCQRF